MTSALQYALSFCDAINMALRRQQRFVRRYQIFMKHSRNIVRLAITFTLILIGLLSMPGAGRQTKASAAHAAPFSSGVAAQGLMTESSLAVGENADGRLEVFAVGPDRALRHNWQLTPGGSWSGWASLGGVIVGSPAVARDDSGSLVVFVRGTNDAVWLKWQLTPGSSGSWSGWYTLGGVIKAAPVVATNADGRLEVFTEGTDRALWHKWQLTPGGDSWSGWASLGTEAIDMFDPAVARNADGRLVVFVGDTDGCPNLIWQLPGGGWNRWAHFAGCGFSSPILATNADGRLEVFVWWTDGSIRHNWQLTPGNTGRVEPPGQAWSDWHTL